MADPASGFFRLSATALDGDFALQFDFFLIHRGSNHLELGAQVAAVARVCLGYLRAF